MCVPGLPPRDSDFISLVPPGIWTIKRYPLPWSHDSTVQPRCKATLGPWPKTQQG